MDRFAVEMVAIGTPRVVGSRRLRGLELMIEGLGVDDFSLAGRLVIDRVGEGLVFVEDSNFSFGILTDRDLSIAQGIVWAVGLDLVDDIVSLYGQVFRERTDLLMTQRVAGDVNIEMSQLWLKLFFT